MYRCVLRALVWALVAFVPQWAQAQVSRLFPREALRGEVVVVDPPVATLNGQPIQLAPGARVRGQDNMLVMSGRMIGQRLVVNFTIDDRGDLKDVWILRDDELARLWPRTPAEAATWRFDPIAQLWTRP
jgi:hypothetical protein